MVDVSFYKKGLLEEVNVMEMDGFWKWIYNNGNIFMHIDIRFKEYA